MKYAILMILLCTISVTSQAQSQTLTDELIKINFTQASTLEDLEEVKEAMTARNITLTYSEVKFDSGKLKGLKISVDCNDGFSGSASSSWTLFGSVGFSRDYRKDAPTPFRTWSN